MSPRPTVWLVDPFLIDFGWSDGADTHTQYVLVDTFIWYFSWELFTIKKIQNQRVYLEVSVDDEAVVHVLQTKDDFSSVETHFFLAEHTVLRQVVVQVAP